MAHEPHGAGDDSHILQAALDEYEEEAPAGTVDLSTVVQRAVEAERATPRKISKAGDDDKLLQDALQEILGDLKDPEVQKALQMSLAQLTTATAADGSLDTSKLETPANAQTETVAAAAAASLFSTLAAGEGVSGADTLNKTLEMLQRLSVESDGKPGSSAAMDATEAMSDEVLKRMMEEFEAMGKKEDFNNTLENMMKQLLAKDLMYLPMKQIAAKFPEWLAKNRKLLSKEDYEKYGKQYQCFQLIVMVYETEPDNFPRLAALMQQLQEQGNPPPEIIKELAPGLELTPDGLPQMPGMPAMPSVPGVDGTSACTIM